MTHYDITHLGFLGPSYLIIALAQPGMQAKPGTILCWRDMTDMEHYRSYKRKLKNNYLTTAVE